MYVCFTFSRGVLKFCCIDIANYYQIFCMQPLILCQLDLVQVEQSSAAGWHEGGRIEVEERSRRSVS